MANNTGNKHKQAKAQAVIESIPKKGEADYYSGTDLLKHYIRKHYWKKRIENLKRDRLGQLEDGVSYLSFCSKYAFDVRYFWNNGLIKKKGKETSFAFVENDQESYELLDSFKYNYANSVGFFGSLADIATDSTHENYGNFWKTFPYDVINLDYLGDILSVDNQKIGVSDFYAIQAIISKQALSRKPYELWITLRVKDGRYDQEILHAFRGLLDHNLDNVDRFKRKFDEKYPGMEILDIEDEELMLIGYIKWLFFVCKQNYSVILRNKIKIIKYKRHSEKDSQDYFLYNIFMRVVPYNNIVIPTPTCDAAVHSEEEYLRGVVSSFNDPIDVSEEFNNLSDKIKGELKKELEDLNNEYIEFENGYII